LSYPSDGERLVALIVKRSKTGSSEVREDEIEGWIADIFKRQWWKPLENLRYVFEVADCSRVCLQHLSRYTVTLHQLQDHKNGLGFLLKLLRSAGRFVELPCKETDYMCYALALDRLEKKLESEVNETKQRELLEIVEESFLVPVSVKSDKEVYKEYIRYLLDTLKLYLVTINKGIPFEDAMYILPQATLSSVTVIMSAKELITEFLPEAMCAVAHPEVREVAWKMWSKLKSTHPRIFKYVGPKCVLMENTMKDRLVQLDDYLEDRATIEVIPRCPEQVARKDILTCLKNTFAKTYNMR